MIWIVLPTDFIQALLAIPATLHHFYLRLEKRINLHKIYYAEPIHYLELMLKFAMLSEHK